MFIKIQLALALIYLKSTICTGTGDKVRGILPDIYSEGPCNTPEPKPTKLSEDFFAKALFQAFTSPRLFMPVASRHAYLDYARAFLGRPVKDLVELNKMDARFRFLPSYTLKSEGYSKIIVQQCIVVTQTQTENVQFTKGFCPADRGLSSPDTDVSSFKNSIYIVTWSDNQDTAVLYRCLEGKRDWFVWSFLSNLDRTTEDKILEHVQKLGFNLTNVAYDSYGKESNDKASWIADDLLSIVQVKTFK